MRLCLGPAEAGTGGARGSSLRKPAPEPRLGSENARSPLGIALRSTPWTPRSLPRAGRRAGRLPRGFQGPTKTRETGRSSSPNTAARPSSDGGGGASRSCASSAHQSHGLTFKGQRKDSSSGREGETASNPKIAAKAQRVGTRGSKGSDEGGSRQDAGDRAEGARWS